MKYIQHQGGKENKNKSGVRIKKKLEDSVAH